MKSRTIVLLVARWQLLYAGRWRKMPALSHWPTATLVMIAAGRWTGFEIYGCPLVAALSLEPPRPQSLQLCTTIERAAILGCVRRQDKNLIFGAICRILTQPHACIQKINTISSTRIPTSIENLLINETILG